MIYMKNITSEKVTFINLMSNQSDGKLFGLIFLLMMLLSAIYNALCTIHSTYKYTRPDESNGNKYNLINKVSISHTEL